ncbi:tRNA methyltransferase 10 homolog C [Oryzias latipes]|uniref:tRNA methyltransferase 10 homolog C n=1 Tax=Oryzias latipes TaxID=8090 RepID=H2LJV2_ORYLA|nr:tRNA methyltransferase 10 homolog C [Oryzias latipes]
MLRHLFSKGCNGLRIGCQVGTPRSQVRRFLPLTCDGVQLISCRRLCSGHPKEKDLIQTKEDKSEQAEPLDLDQWKVVMRSQAKYQEQKVDDGLEGSNDGSLDENGDDCKNSSSLEATRELVSMWRQAGKLVPQEMTEDELQTLSELTTKSSRKKYLKYLAIREGYKLSRKEKQAQKRAEKEATMKENRGGAEEGSDQENNQIPNSLFLKFWGHSFDRVFAWRSAQAMLFGQPLVFDFSYESNMSRREIENTVSQLLEVEGWNRRAIDPFHLHFCNLQPDGPYHQELIKRYSAEVWDRLLVTNTERHYVELFPKEQLVYLTADSPNVLHSFDHSKIYIIGALVDRSIQPGLSLANAKRLKLATARLPLDEFLHWETGAKNLTLDQMIRIMLSIKMTGKWEEALTFVPERKHDGLHQQQTKPLRTNTTTRGFTNQGWREHADRPLKFKKTHEKRTFMSPDQSKREPGGDRIVGAKEKSTSGTRVRTSLKSNLENRKAADRNKMWWDDD